MLKLPPRLRVWLLRIGGGLVLLAGILYLLRWPLLEGRLRRELAKVVADELDGDLAAIRLSGSLIFSATAEEVLIEGRPQAPYRTIAARRVVASYGFLGMGRLKLDILGAEAVFRSDPSRPADDAKTLRDVEEILRSFSFPGDLRVADAGVVLPDGRRIAIREASFDGVALRAAARVPGLGDVEASMDRRPDGMSADARASEGPLRRARLERNGEDLRVTLEGEGRVVEGSARLRRGPDGTLQRAAGEFASADGRVRVEADFQTGRVDAHLDLAFDVESPVQARLSLVGHAAGPLMGPLSAWRLDQAAASAERVRWKDLEFEAVRVEIPDATLDAVTWRATARRGPDRFAGEGAYRGGAIEGSLEAKLQASAPYVPEVAAADVVVRGRFRSEGGFRFGGRVTTGAGEAAGLTWTSLEGDVDLGPDGVEIPSLRMKGWPPAPEAALSGSVDFLEPKGFSLRASAISGEDRLHLEGVGDATGRFEGRWAGAVVLEGLPVRAAGRVAREGTSMRIALEPGEIGGVRHEALEVRIDAERATLAEAGVALADPPAAARLEGSLSWAEGKLAGEARLRDLVLRGTPLGGAVARISRGKGEEGVEIDAAWDAGEGAGAELRGRWGSAKDLRLLARIPDLARLKPIVGTSTALAGAAALDVRATGSPEAPELSGLLSVAGLTVEGIGPLSFGVPVRTEGRRVLLLLEPCDTPYGRMSFEARLPLPGSPEPLQAELRLEARKLQAFAPLVPEDFRPYVPEGKLDLVATASEKSWKVTAELRVPSAQGPEPFGQLTEFAATGTLDAAGLRVEPCTGRIGGGPFTGRLFWERGRPLRAELQGRELLAVSTRLSRVRVSADLVFTWEQGGRGLLAGKASVPLALIHEEPGSPGVGGGDGGLAVGGLRLRPSTAGGVAVPGVKGMNGVDLDLRVDTTGEVRVENSIVGALLRVDGRLRGTLAEPAASGTAKVKSGEIKLPAAIFVRIEEAQVDIPAEPNRSPVVQFVGRVGRGEDSIEIRVQGPLARPELTLRSEPPRPKEELLARLAFGHAPGQVSESAVLTTLAFRIVDQYAAGWPSAEPGDPFLSRLRPVILSDDTTDSRRAPWQLPSNRTSRGMVVRTEYLWTPYFSVIGEADREANVGGDIKLRLRFR